MFPLAGPAQEERQRRDVTAVDGGQIFALSLAGLGSGMLKMTQPQIGFSPILGLAGEVSVPSHGRRAHPSPDFVVSVDHLVGKIRT